jgi:hypothetical protein
MLIRATLMGCICCAALAGGMAAVAQPPRGSASPAPKPAASAPQATPPAGSSVNFKVSFGDAKPGKPAQARLQIPAMNIDVATNELGERALPGVPKGKVTLKVFVAGADPCSLQLDIAGDKVTKVHLFIPKRGLELKCERLQD